MPSISVIVAVFNRAATLQSCLDSIFGADRAAIGNNRLRRRID